MNLLLTLLNYSHKSVLIIIKKSMMKIPLSNGKSSHKNLNLLNMYSLSDHSRCKMSFFLHWNRFGEFSLTSLAHKRILCSEWVPSEWEFKLNLFLKNTDFHFTVRFNWLDLCGLLVGYCDVFINCVDTHSDGTHSLQRIHLPLPDSDSAGHVGCIDGRGRGGVFRSDAITELRSKCCEVLFRHTI